MAWRLKAESTDGLKADCRAGLEAECMHGLEAECDSWVCGWLGS